MIHWNFPENPCMRGKSNHRHQMANKMEKEMKKREVFSDSLLAEASLSLPHRGQTAMQLTSKL